MLPNELRMWHGHVLYRFLDSNRGPVTFVAFGGSAFVFKAIPEGPDHVHVPNAEYVWTEIMRVPPGCGDREGRLREER